MNVQSCFFGGESKPVAFLPFSLPSPSSFLKLPDETAALLVFQTSPVGVEFFSYAITLFCSNIEKICIAANHSIKKNN